MIPSIEGHDSYCNCSECRGVRVAAQRQAQLERAAMATARRIVSRISKTDPLAAFRRDVSVGVRVQRQSKPRGARHANGWRTFPPRQTGAIGVVPSYIVRDVQSLPDTE